MSTEPEPLGQKEAEKLMEEGTDRGDQGASISDTQLQEPESDVDGALSCKPEYEFKWLNDDQFRGRGAQDVRGIDPSEVDITGEDL